MSRHNIMQLPSLRMSQNILQRFMIEGLDTEMAYRKEYANQDRLKTKWMKRKRKIYELWGDK